jgi:hypothetical protein
MSGHAVLVLDSKDKMNTAHHWINRAPRGTRVEFKGPQRSIEQNSRMWAMLTDVATQKTLAERKFSTDQWKAIFMHALGREIMFLPTLDNSTFIPWGQSSSDLSTEEMSDLIESMFAWGAENGVVWSDPKEVALRELDQRFPGDRENAA